MRRADTIARAAIANTRRRQLARLVEALELMVNTPARTPDESTAKEAAIADLLQRNTATRERQPAHFAIPKVINTSGLRLLFPDVINRNLKIGGKWRIISR